MIWYDPEQHYTGIVDDLALPDTRVARYTDSFFRLRHEIEPLMGGTHPPRLVIYVPLAEEQTHHALIEAEVAGVIIKPGQQPPTRNTRLSLVARNALKSLMGEETAATIEKQVEDGMLTLADLDRLGEKGEGISKGVVSVIFGTGSPQEIALALLSSRKHDAAIEAKKAQGELAVLMRGAFEIDLPAGRTLDEWRAQLARHLLATDLAMALVGEPPAQLMTVKVAMKPASREACVGLSRKWRLMRDLSCSYIEHASRVENELGLATIRLTREQIAEAETFLSVERKLQHSVESELLQQASEPMVEMARRRQSSFWAEQLPEVQARWALIAVAGQLLLEANRIESEIKASSFDAQTMFDCYTDAERPWSALDTNHRHMERRYHNFDFDLDERDEVLEQLITKARQRYMEVASLIAEQFTRSYQESKFTIGKALRQTRIFEKKVQPALAEGKTAYVWVDALRFEMARELVESLQSEFDAQLQAALACVPTITEIGMAALLPVAQHAIRLVSAGDRPAE
ncbi:MAG: PglZ domain-containing protein [Acidobacteriota bacterium]